MSEGTRYTAGYLGAVFAPEVGSEKEAVICMNEGVEPDRWFVDTEEGRAEFKALIAEVAQGNVHKVVLRDRIVLPNDVAQVGEFFDALVETDTELAYVEQGTTNPTEKFLAQLVPLLHEWNNGESAFMAERGWHTLHADTQDILWLRTFLHRSGTPQARRWLERLLPQLGEKVVDQPAGECLASLEIQNRRYAAGRVSEIIADHEDPTPGEIEEMLEREAVEAERTLEVEASAQEESDRDEYLAMYFRRRADEIERSDDLSPFDREARAIVLREEAELLDRRWNWLER